MWARLSTEEKSSFLEYSVHTNIVWIKDMPRMKDKILALLFHSLDKILNEWVLHKQ